MLARRILPFGLVLAFAGGCHHSASAQTQVALHDTPAPFASPPVLAGTPDIATLVARVKPAVVNITTEHAIKTSAHPRFALPFDMPGFDFGERGGRGDRGDGEDRVQKQQALGSGFLIDNVGHVVTNAHVVEGADTVRVRLADNREFDATVKGKDLRLDVAVLELQGAKDLPAASLGKSDATRVGEYVVAIGNPFGLGNTVTMGIVSAKGREIGAGPYDDFIQTDASINPGNSGGPLFDLHGQVVGINTAINPNGQGIGFAIPIDAVREILPQLLSRGHVERGRLGVAVKPVDETMAKALGLGNAKGAVVAAVEKGGPAEAAGVHEGDVILSVDGQAIDREQDLPRAVARHAPGARVAISVLRGGHNQTIATTLGALTDKPEQAGNSDEK